MSETPTTPDDDLPIDQDGPITIVEAAESVGQARGEPEDHVPAEPRPDLSGEADEADVADQIADAPVSDEADD